MKKDILQSDKITLKEFKEFRFHPIMPVSDLIDIEGNPLADTFPYWRKHKLLPFVPKGTWNVEISFSQLIWLRILDHLRSLGYSLKDTQKLCDYLFKDAYFNDLPRKNLEASQEILRKKELAGTIDNEDQLLLLEYERILTDPLLRYGLKFEINYLTNLVSWCIDNGEEAGLLVFANGKVAEKRGDTINTHLQDSIDIKSPHIYLSIQYFLKEFICNDALETIITPYLLTDNEKTVLKEIRNKNVKELKITCNNGGIFRIDTHEQKTLTPEKTKEIRKLLGLHNYEEVSISTRDEKNLTFKKIKKNITSG